MYPPKNTDFLKSFIALTTLFFIGFCSANVKADVNLILPAYTKHIQYYDTKDYTEDFDNTSIGLEWSNKHVDTGAVRVFKNSHDKKSVYLYGIAYPNQLNNDLKFGGGLLLAMGGYEMGAMASPICAVKYKWVRVTTTYPFGRLTQQKMDLLNVQLVIPLGK